MRTNSLNLKIKKSISERVQGALLKTSVLLICLFAASTFKAEAQVSYDAQIQTSPSFDNDYWTMGQNAVDSVKIRCHVYNNSSAAITGVVVQAFLYPDGSLDDSITMTSTSIASAATVEFDFGYYQTTCQNLNVIFRVKMNETDAFPTNNVSWPVVLLHRSWVVREEGSPTTAWLMGNSGQWAKELIMPQDVRIDGVTMLVASAYTGTGNIAGALYSSNADTPHMVLGQSDTIVLVGSDAGTWVKFNFDAVDITAGTKYWLVIEEDGSFSSSYFAMNRNYVSGRCQYRADIGVYWNWLDVSRGDTRDFYLRPLIDSCQTLTLTETLSHESFGNDGSISVDINGSPLLYTFSWSNGSTSQNISGLAPGDYTVTVSNCYGCEYTETYTILPMSTGLDNSLQSNGWKLFPNPTSDQLYLENMSEEAWNSLEVFSISGAKIFGQDLNDSKNLSIDVSNYSKGMYILKLSNATSSATGSFMVE